MVCFALSSEEQLRKENRLLRAEIDLFHTLVNFSENNFSLDRVLENFLTHVTRMLNTSAGTIFVIDPTTHELVSKIVQGQDRDKIKRLRLAPSQGIVGLVAKTGKARLVRNVRKDPHWWPVVADFIGYPTKDILAFPLKSRNDKLIGVLELLNTDSHPGFTEEDVEHLLKVSCSAAMLLEIAELSTQNEQRNRQLCLLNDVSHLVNSTLDPEEVYQRTIKAAVRLVDCEVGSLLLVDTKTGELFFDVALGKSGFALKKVRLKPGEGVAGWVAAHAKPVVIHDCESDTRWSSRLDKHSDFISRNMICVPVIHKEKVIGVLQVLNKKNGRFVKNDVEMLQSLGDRVAVALENARLFNYIEQTLFETTETLAESIELRDRYTGGHTRRVVNYSLAIGQRLNLTDKELEQVRLAAILHDIGKIGVDDQILRKNTKLNDEEYAKMKQHPVLGAEILSHIHYLAGALPGIRYHHERYDGCGYPDGIAGNEIPIIARIISVADAYDAMTSERSYHKEMKSKDAAKEIYRCSGTQFDPIVVQAFLDAFCKGEITGQHELMPNASNPAQIVIS